MIYLVEKDQLEHLVVATLKAKRYVLFDLWYGRLHCVIPGRLPEAIQLVEMYYQDKEKFAGAEALKV